MGAFVIAAVLVPGAAAIAAVLLWPRRPADDSALWAEARREQQRFDARYARLKGDADAIADAIWCEMIGCGLVDARPAAARRWWE